MHRVSGAPISPSSDEHVTPAGGTTGGATPTLDAVAGTLDAAAGTLDGTATSPDGAAGPADGTAGPADGTAGPPDGAVGPPDGTAGLSDGAASTLDGDAIMTDGDSGTPDGAAPAADGAPPTDSAPIATDGAAPAADGTAPTADGAASPDLLGEDVTHELVGSTFVQVHRPELDARPVLVFPFTDIASKAEGVHRLRYRVFNIFARAAGAQERPVLAECAGAPFRVYNSRSFPGLREITPLTKVCLRPAAAPRRRADETPRGRGHLHRPARDDPQAQPARRRRGRPERRGLAAREGEVMRNVRVSQVQ
jgi:hypothetical protein